MREIVIHEIQDGMELAADIVDDKGQVLFSSGRRLERDHIELLERRGILTVSVVDPNDETAGDSSAPSQEELQQALSRLEHMFSEFGDDPVMQAIHAAARNMLEMALPGRR